MDAETVSRTLAFLNRLEGLAEARHATYFRCSRQRPDGGSHELLLEVLDAGPGANPATRYWVSVTSVEDGRRAGGSGGPTVDEALTTLRWWELDTDPAAVADDEELSIGDEGGPG